MDPSLCDPPVVSSLVLFYPGEDNEAIVVFNDNHNLFVAKMNDNQMNLYILLVAVGSWRKKLMKICCWVMQEKFDVRHVVVEFILSVSKAYEFIVLYEFNFFFEIYMNSYYLII